jgi:hypothetical protein
MVSTRRSDNTFDTEVHDRKFNTKFFTFPFHKPLGSIKKLFSLEKFVRMVS